MLTDLSSAGDGDNKIIDYSKLFAKDTPPAPPGSSDWVVENAKAFYHSEHEAYIRLDGHPRILRYHGWDKRGLLFDSHPGGDLLCYLLKHQESPPSLPVRLQWIRDIAEGLAFIHSKGIIWVDVSLPNVLLSEDHRAILCDFAGSRILPVPGLKVPSWTDRETQVRLSPMKTMPRYPHTRAWQGPGGPYPNSEPNPNEFNPNDDRFGFGIVLFSLLALRFPHSANLVIRDLLEVQKIWELHQNLSFDTLGEIPDYKDFETIIQKCFRAEYLSADDLLHDVRAACDAMPSDAPLLQDKMVDPPYDFAEWKSGRQLYPFPKQRSEDYYSDY
ncbi:kinase-like domain-containing protein [Mycena polygramma]|nr:kinase-like domain-containing protein [Mycena polygramma]